MTVYFVVFFITLILSIALPAETDKQWRLKLLITFLPLFLFGALRVDFGNDYAVYEGYFEEFHKAGAFVFDSNSHSEIGFQFLCYLMPSFRSVLILNSLLLCLAFAIFIYRNIPQEYLWLAILLIFLNADKNIYGSLVGMRGGFAIISFLLGSIFVQRRQLVWFALTTLVAVSFHTSAIFFMPIAYFIGRNSKITKVEIFLWIVILLVLGGMSSVGLLNLVTPFLLNYFERYELYITEFTGHKGPLMIAATSILFVLLFMLFYSCREKLTARQNSICRIGLLYVASLFMGTLSMRASLFYNMFFVGTVVTLISFKDSNRVLRTALFVLAIAMSSYSLYLWMHATHVYDNPLYQVYQSVLG